MAKHKNSKGIDAVKLAKERHASHYGPNNPYHGWMDMSESYRQARVKDAMEDIENGTTDRNVYEPN